MPRYAEDLVAYDFSDRIRPQWDDPTDAHISFADLIGHSSESSNPKIIRRTAAEVLQARGVCQIACVALGKDRGCEVERFLLPEYSEDARDRYWERLESGKLRLSQAYANEDTLASKHLGLLRAHTDRADRFLALELWALVDTAPQQLDSLLEHRRSLSKRCVIPHLCDGTREDARRLREDVRTVTVAGEFWLTTSAMLCFIHLARTVGDLTSYLIGFAEWFRAVDDSYGSASPHGFPLMVYLEQYFTQVTLRSASREGARRALWLASSVGLDATVIDSEDLPEGRAGRVIIELGT